MEPLKIPGTNIQAGVSQWNSKPDWISNTANTLLFLAAAYSMFVAPNLDLSDALRADINQWLLSGVGFVKFASKFLGVKIEEPIKE